VVVAVAVGGGGGGGVGGGGRRGVRVGRINKNNLPSPES